MTRLVILTLLFQFSLFSIFAQSVNQTDDRGRKQGKWLKTYKSGSIRYEGQFRDDMPYGTFQYYYPTGEREAVNEFSEDGIIANSKVYYQNGNLLAEGKYINQKKEGIWLYYSEPDNKLLTRENYKAGKIHGERKSYYAETGNILENFIYENGLKNGPYKKYFPDGNVMTEGSYLKGELQGEFVSFYPNGQVQVRGNYNNGRQIGNWEYFDESGQMLTKEDFNIKEEEINQPE